MYVHRLTEQRKFHDAAIQCRELFHEEDAAFWDRWVFVFAQVRWSRLLRVCCLVHSLTEHLTVFRNVRPLPCMG